MNRYRVVITAPEGTIEVEVPSATPTLAVCAVFAKIRELAVSGRHHRHALLLQEGFASVQVRLVSDLSQSVGLSALDPIPMPSDDEGHCPGCGRWSVLRGAGPDRQCEACHGAAVEASSYYDPSGLAARAAGASFAH